MQGWLKNGARMTVAVTAFAAAGAGIAYSHESRPAQQADHTAIELTAVTLPAGGPLAREFGQVTGIGGPLGCMSYIGKPTQTVPVPADGNDSTSEAAKYGMGVLGTDTDEEYTNPADIPGSDRDTSTTLGAGDTDEESTDPANIPAADQDDQMCTSASTTGTMPSGHHHGTGTGHHGSGHHGSGHHGTGHHGTGTGRHHHGTGSGSKHHGTGSGMGRGRHGKGGMSMNGGRCHHHMTGGKPSSTGGKPASAGAKKASTTAATVSTSTAAASGTLPTTGAPLAALLGLAVAALAAGLVARRITKRDDEAEPEEG
jgi:hypothetical protein